MPSDSSTVTCASSPIRSSLDFLVGKAGVKEDFPGGPVVEGLPSSAGAVGFISGQGTKIPHPAGQLSLQATTPAERHSQREKRVHRNGESRMLQLGPSAAK